ncbi:MAG: LptE family protein [Fuerstiella sp.]|nr:LptE family protein [Fuerstiella sp.]
MSRSLHLTTVVALGLVVCCAAGCGYLLGPSNVQGVRTVHVPIFKSDSFRRNLDYLLTEAVHKEIKLRTGYRLADADCADTVLEGRIIDARKNTLSETRFDDPREVQLMLGVQISWIDRRTGRVLQQQTFPIGQELAMHSSQVSFAAEVGHSLATAQQESIQRLAGQIVDLTEMPW